MPSPAPGAGRLVLWLLHMTLILLVACAFVIQPQRAAAAAVEATAAAPNSAPRKCPYGSRPCADGCSPPLGFCVHHTCYDRKGRAVACEPAYDLCSNGGVACSLDTFCAGSACRPNTCKDRRLYHCPGDHTELRSVECEATNSTAKFTDCYRSAHFNCSLGPSKAIYITCSISAANTGSLAIRHQGLGWAAALAAAMYLFVWTS